LAYRVIRPLFITVVFLTVHFFLELHNLSFDSTFWLDCIILQITYFKIKNEALNCAQLSRGFVFDLLNCSMAVTD